MGNDLLMNISAGREHDPFYFDANIVEPLALKKRELRSESEYEVDVNAEKTALNYIKRVSECFEGNIYLLVASQDVVRPNRVRTKKGVLWQEEELRKLDYRNGEFDVGDGNTRLVSLVNLDGFNYNDSETLVLSWLFSVIILTSTDIDTLNGYVAGWLSKKASNTVLAFNYEALAKDLLMLDTTVAMRYFPADNGRSEMLVAVGNREFVSGSVETCIDSIVSCTHCAQ